MHRADLFPGGAVIETEAPESLVNEAGGHRIQRVPPTERRGRVHTSTVTVSVLSEGEAERVQEGFAVRWFSGTGKGGQHRNKHQNCCEVTHLQTGLRRAGTASRSRVANLRDAMSALEGDLSHRSRTGEHARRNDTRRTQIGSGMRGDKRRTYRFQEDSVTDHVTGRRAKASAVMRGAFDLLW